MTLRTTTIRRRNRVFRRRRGRRAGKVLLWLLVIPAAIGGYFLARHLMTGAVPPAASEPATPVTRPAEPALPEPEPDPDPLPESPLKGMRGIYLPAEALRDPAKWDEVLRGAAAAGYTNAVVDLKDGEGRLWYQSATGWAAAARSVQKNALTREQLTAGAATLREEYGIETVPRLFAFQDNTAPRYLETGRVAVQGSPGITWFDADPARGGRRWLNPYSPDAREYITGLAAELKALGFTLLMVDGVRFPAQESQAWYGDADQTALPRNQILAAFCGEMNAAFGSDNWLLCTGALAAVGEETAVYGGNPVTFGAPAAAPLVLPDTMGSKLLAAGEQVASPASHPYEASALIFRQLAARLELMEQPPPAVPWLAAADADAQIAALTEVFGEGAPHILYDEKGRYGFIIS